MMNNDTVTDIRVEDIHTDIFKLVKHLLRRAIIIVAAAVIGLLLAYLVFDQEYYPQYSTTTLLHIEYPQLEAETEEELQVQLQKRQDKDPVNIFSSLLSSRSAMEEVIERAGLSCSYRQIGQMVSLGRLASAEFFQLTVYGYDADEIVRVANGVAEVLSEKAAEMMGEGRITVEDQATEPIEITSKPSIRSKLFLGAAAGAFIAAVVIVCMYLLSGKIHDEDYLAQNYPGVPLLALIPGKKKGVHFGANGHAPYGGDADAEAYKLLRTNLTYAFSGEQKDCVIGLTSSLGDEGKSWTAVELARTMAGAEKKVLLVEADMRAPVLAQRLGLQESGGLSGLLSGKNGADSAVVTCTADADTGKVSYDVMPAGAVPTDPTVLLSSGEMERLLEQLRGKYDHVLVDLPPAAAVADAVIAARMVDGMAVVIEAEKSERKGLAEAMRRLHMADANVLGFVFCGAGTSKQKKTV